MDLRRLDHMPSVATAMTPFPFSVALDAPAAEAEALMREHDLRHVPVREGDDIVGVVTDRDIARGRAAADREGRPGALAVGDVCARDPWAVDLHAPLDRVVREMAERRVGSAVVLREGRLAGIFTTTDACRLLADILAARFPGPDDEAA